MKRKHLICIITLLMNTLNATGQSTEELMKQDWPNLKKYAPENAELLKSGKHPKVIFIGNSITEVWADHYPEFFEEHNFLGRGISGQTTPQMLIRFTQDVLDLEPEVVVILAGTNDIAGNTGFATEKMITDNISAMTELAASRGIKVVLCSILPVYDYAWRPGLQPAGKIIAINSWLQAYAVQKGHVYVDYHKAMADDKGGMKNTYSEDGVHPNARGYEVMRPLILNGIQSAFQNE